MIIHLKKYRQHGYLKAIFLMAKKVFLTAKYKLNLGVEFYQQKSELNFYPSPVLDEDNKWGCVGCQLCADICPTHCVEIEGHKGSSILEGQLPNKFTINLSQCVRCNKCIEVCPVNVLSSNGSYLFSEFKTPINFLKFSEK